MRVGVRSAPGDLFLVSILDIPAFHVRSRLFGCKFCVSCNANGLLCGDKTKWDLRRFFSLKSKLID